MYTIIGLGNPGPAYHKTKHNIGALFLEYLGAEPPKISKSLYNFSEFSNLKLVTLNTYMNESGKGVLSLMAKKKIKKENIIVIYDDMDLEFSKLKIKQSGADGGHKGIRSIISGIGRDFFRIRAGIGRPNNTKTVTDYVLGRFTTEEYEELIHNVFPRLKEYIYAIRDKGLDSALGMASILK